MRRINPAGWGVLLACLLCGADVAAVAGDVLPPDVTLGELETAQARNLLLEQKVQTARLEQQLRESLSAQSAERNAPVSSTQPLLPPVTSADPTASVPGETMKRAGSLRLQEIYGRGNQLRARIVLPEGGVIEVVKGDRLPGTTKRVTEVTPTFVRLDDNSELSF